MRLAHRVLFVHTGGLLGMYDKLEQLQQQVGGRTGQAAREGPQPYGPRVKRFEFGDGGPGSRKMQGMMQ